MNKQNLSTRDRWMIENWAKARQFEDAMESARNYYEQLFDKVLEKVKKKHPGLRNHTPRRLSKRVAEGDWEDGGGCAAFHSPKWRRDRPSWPSGIWISNISLDELVMERAPAPNSSIWLSVSKSSVKRIGKLRDRLLTKARRDRGCRNLDFERQDESSPRTCLCYDLPEERSELLDMVLRDDGQPFVNRIAQHVETMARLLQGSDDFLR